MSRPDLPGQSGSFEISSPSGERTTSDGPGHLAAAEAASASVNVLRGTVNDGLNALDIGLPGTVAPTMRMAHLNAEGHALVAELTLSHAGTLLLESSVSKQLCYYSRPFSQMQAFFLHSFASFLLPKTAKFCTM